MALSWGTTLTYPRDVLQKERPTSSLLGPVTLGSVLGMQAIHLFFLILALTMMWNDPEYIKWPLHLTKGECISKGWPLAPTFGSSVRVLPEEWISKGRVWEVV